MDLTEIKKAIEDQGTAFAEFKKANDARLAEIAQKGSADVLTEDKLKKIEQALDTSEALNQRITQAEQSAKTVTETMARLETAYKRLQTGGDKAPSEAEQKAAEYRGSFNSYCRKGREDMGAEQRTVLEAKKVEIKALIASDDTQGGYYVAPPEMEREILKNVIEISPIRTISRVTPIGTRSLQIPKRTGTFAARWVSESGARTETEGYTTGMDEIVAHELTAEVYVSMQMLEDSMFDLESELNMEFSEQFALAEGTGFVTGNGAGRPEGFLANANVSSTNSGAAATIADADGQANGLISMFYALKTVYSAQGVWTLNRTTIGSVRKLKDSQKNYIWQPGLANGAPNTILGQPYVEVPDMPSEGANNYPIAFGNFRRGYRIVDRIVLSVMRDPYTQAGNGRIKFLARRRVGGQVVQAEAIRKLKCAT